MISPFIEILIFGQDFHFHESQLGIFSDGELKFFHGFLAESKPIFELLLLCISSLLFALLRLSLLLLLFVEILKILSNDWNWKRENQNTGHSANCTHKLSKTCILMLYSKVNGFIDMEHNQ